VWEELPRGTKGVIYISRFGGSGPAKRPIATEKVEVWPIHVRLALAAALSSNTAQMFTVTASVPEEPEEDAVVTA